MFILLKKKIFPISAADTISSCTEAVDELFQHTMGYDCMEHDVNTIAACVYMSIAYSAKKNRFSLLWLHIPSAAALKLLTGSSRTSWVVNACNMVCSPELFKFKSFAEKKTGKKEVVLEKSSFFSLPHLHIVVILHWCPARGYTLYYDEF